MGALSNWRLAWSNSIDTIKCQFGIPDRKLEKLCLKLDHIIESRIATFTSIAKLAGFYSLSRLAVTSMKHIEPSNLGGRGGGGD